MIDAICNVKPDASSPNYEGNQEYENPENSPVFSENFEQIRPANSFHAKTCFKDIIPQISNIQSHSLVKYVLGFEFDKDLRFKDSDCVIPDIFKSKTEYEDVMYRMVRKELIS